MAPAVLTSERSGTGGLDWDGGAVAALDLEVRRDLQKIKSFLLLEEENI